ncbi:hypothetical protein FJR38_04405 [Anabaena sp. UHCC 0253]|uniref:hypothetical protein n=1 Tax=Anabaena sp. UHCC 0253 TaxID=2590019 RepID=UPI001445386F|nr:hypothetical protein [Anabaena sp. UHCC 0253]MTJ51967.1 hypothetical protein [Anabaena sp. UHCC 0253]
MFPLKYGHPAQLSDEPSLEIEAHILLDPCKKGEAFLISFEAGGLAVPAEGDDEDKYRADKTIEILGLNRLGRLVDNRSDKWNKCLFKILEYENASGHQALKIVHRALATNALKEMVKPEEEFSSVALACINKIAPMPLRQEIMT